LGKNPKWRLKIKMASGRFFLNKKSTETPSSVCWFKSFYLKNPTCPKFDKMAEIFKMASETCIFKNLGCIQSVFLLSNFCRNFFFFSKIQNGGFFEEDVIFEKKSTFFKKVLPILNTTYFKSLKSNLMIQRPKIYHKNLPK
jgi:hypothetical protein